MLDVLRSTDWLPVAGEEEPAPRRRGPPSLDDATDERVAALTGVLPGLLPAPWSRRSDGPALAALGVRRVGLAEVVEAVRGVDRPASWWAALYAALDGADREEIAALPVPLADGRVAHGPAGVLLPDPGLPVDRLGPLGLRLADPEAVATPAARRLLERLGARPATAAAVLADPAVRAVVETSMDAVEDRLDEVRSAGHWPEAVLALVAAARPGGRRAALARRARAPRRRGRVGARGGAGAARLAAGRSRSPRAPSARWTPGSPRRAIPTRCGRSVCSTRSPWSAGPIPTSSTSTAPPTGPMPCSTGCPTARRRPSGRR